MTSLKHALEISIPRKPPQSDSSPTPPPLIDPYLAGGLPQSILFLMFNCLSTCDPIKTIEQENPIGNKHLIQGASLTPGKAAKQYLPAFELSLSN